MENKDLEQLNTKEELTSVDGQELTTFNSLEQTDIDSKTLDGVIDSESSNSTKDEQSSSLDNALVVEEKSSEDTPSLDSPQFEMIEIDEKGEPSIISYTPTESELNSSDEPIVEIELPTLPSTEVKQEVIEIDKAEPKKKTTTKRKSSTTKKTTKKYHSVEELDKLPKKEYSKTLSRQMFMTHVLGVKPEKSEMDKRQQFFKKLFTILFLVMMFGVIIYTFYTDFFAPGSHREGTSLRGFFENVGENWYYFFFALISLGVCYLAKGFKLSLLCKSMTNKWHFRTCMQTGIIGHYYNNVTPLGAGGQPFEIYHLSKNGVHGGTASSLPIATFFMFQFAFVVFGIFNICCFTPETNLFNLPESILASTTAEVLRPLAIIGVVCGLFMPGIVILFSLLPRLCSKLVYFVINIGNKLKIVKDPKLLTRKTLKTVIQNSKCIKKMVTRPIVLTLSFLISLIEVLAIDSIAFFTLKFFGYDVEGISSFLEWLQIVQVCSILYAAISFIPTPGNSGAADFSFYWLFQTGLVVGFAFPAMIIWRFLSYYSFIIIGFVFLSINKKREHKRHEMEL